MGVYEDYESIRSANTNNVGSETEGQFELPAPSSPLSLGAQNVVSGRAALIQADGQSDATKLILAFSNYAPDVYLKYSDY